MVTDQLPGEWMKLRKNDEQSLLFVRYAGQKHVGGHDSGERKKKGET